MRHPSCGVQELGHHFQELSEGASLWEVDKEFFILVILHCNSKPVRFWLKGVFCIDRENMCDATLLVDIVQKGSSKARYKDKSDKL